ncbi:hypothetical protein QUB80_13575 [Chlorogloeopsis sp. ULAP01]|uniref:hypothetical protein n=1 Tax=Chlorogloeopsis sp. ULAP01 TaxID=3056483 RepID=UPI0025AA9E28|nr:hypothetical protein [Chlorogloeopsis sp. ULAP01]MDM9381733.1 hypothetical protein [Chlorogloeopsis sp. ULAP01]
MQDVPASVNDYLINLMIETRSLAYLLVTKDGCLSSWGGKLSAYGITNLQKGEDVGQQIFFLEGLLPLDDFPLFLPRMKTEYGICADVHIFPSEEGDWVLLLDATLDEMQLSIIQQQVNDFILNPEKVTRVLNQ